MINTFFTIVGEGKMVSLVFAIGNKYAFFPSGAFRPGRLAEGI